jgi:uncharacterized membrane protein
VVALFAAETLLLISSKSMEQTNVPLIPCPQCAFQMPETAAFCPGCGRPMQPEERAQGKVGIFSEPIAGALAYFTFIPAVVFLAVEPYKKNRFVRFHSIQCLMVWIAAILLTITLKLVALLLFIVPVVGPLFVLLVSTLVGLAAVVIWLVLVVKAFQGNMFRLPVLGDFAAQHAARP